jgi:hypothetical protein
MGVQPQLERVTRDVASGFGRSRRASEPRRRAVEIFAALRGLRPPARPLSRVRYAFPLESGDEATRIAAFVTTRRRLPAFR